MLYLKMKIHYKYLSLIPLILLKVQKKLPWAKKLMIFQFWHFSFSAGLWAYFQYDWFILPIPIRRRVRHHVRHQAEVRPCMWNLYFYSIIFILLFYSGIQLGVYQIYPKIYQLTISKKYNYEIYDFLKKDLEKDIQKG